ncbi:MAG: zinc ribbon domain-containing protein [Deltaproteobacteria bacterium]|nr:zinc ribbon domain-containing protein [Deltaproteobacteria bacterium]MBW2193270.1 zinc ribbon domain-containing protein [Deltaproteobacteria bacterium]
MPIYEYECCDCCKQFEYLVFGNEQPDCPSCGGKKINKLMSASTFHSKGSHGQTVTSSASAPSCTGCAATSCSTCD